SLLCLHWVVLSRVDGGSVGSVRHHLFSRWSCDRPFCHLHRCPVRLHQRRHLLYPWQPWCPRWREFVLAACVRLLRCRRHHLRAVEAISGAGMDRDRATLSRDAAWACRGNSENPPPRLRSWSLTSESPQ